MGAGIGLASVPDKEAEATRTIAAKRGNIYICQEVVKKDGCEMDEARTMRFWLQRLEGFYGQGVTH